LGHPRIGAFIVNPNEADFLAHMFARISILFGAQVRTNSEEIGRAADFLIDGDLRALRYLLVAPLGGKPDAEAPVPFSAVADPDLAQQPLSLGLTKDEIGHLAGIDLLPCPSREKEKILHDLIHWRPYWVEQHKNGEPDLHSLKQTLGMRVMCSDGAAGTLDDFFANTADWSAPLLELNYAQHLKREFCLVPTASIGSVNWPEQVVRLTATRKHIDDAPVYEGQASLKASEVEAILRHFRSAGKPS